MKGDEISRESCRDTMANLLIESVLTGYFSYLTLHSALAIFSCYISVLQHKSGNYIIKE